MCKSVSVSLSGAFKGSYMSKSSVAKRISAFSKAAGLGIGMTAGICLASMTGAAADTVSDYRAAIDQLQELREYNSSKKTIIADQKEWMKTIRSQTRDIKDWKVALPGLMEEMIVALEDFVASDIPFKKTERDIRITELRTGLFGVEETATEDAKNVARFMKVLEAFLIENDYGRSIETYDESLEIDGQQVPVDFLMVGRVALYYQAVDGSSFGMWDREAGAWTSDLPGGAGVQIRNALDVAKEKVPPDLLTLPFPAAAGE